MVAALWTAGAVYYDACGGGRRGRACAAWVTGVAAALLMWEPLWQPLTANVRDFDYPPPGGSPRGTTPACGVENLGGSVGNKSWLRG